MHEFQVPDAASVANYTTTVLYHIDITIILAHRQNIPRIIIINVLMINPLYYYANNNSMYVY